MLRMPQSVRWTDLAIPVRRYRGSLGEGATVIPQSAGDDDRADDPATELGRRRRRVVEVLESGDMAAVDAEIEAFATAVPRLGQAAASWYVPLWRGMRALLQGRFAECERQNATAAVLGGGAGTAGVVGGRGGSAAVEAVCTLQLFGLRLAQDRLVELEALARSLATPTDGYGDRTPLVCLLGMLGRDGEARAELARLAVDGFAGVAPDDRRLATIAVLAELAATLERDPEAAILYDELLPHARRFAVDVDACLCHGSVSRHLGLLAHTLGRWDEADAHFRAALDDNASAGAALLVAHTAREWSALLRARDVDDDWERGLELLARSEAIYRRLGVDRLADEARQVLARSHEPPASERGSAGNAFTRDGDGWLLAYAGVEVRLADSLGLHDLAALLANPGRSFHVTDLAAGVFVGGIGHAGQAPSSGRTGEPGAVVDIAERARAEFRRRLAELDRELADGSADPVQVALAWAERDVVAAELAATTAPGEREEDPAERARRSVAARIRLSLDRIDAAHPALGRHLRHSVRTGTFCSYEPEMPTTWPGVRPG